MASSSPPPSSPSTSYKSYPILAITLFAILTTATLLLSYYVFVVKCSMNWRSRHRRTRLPPPSTDYGSTTVHRRGLGEPAIRAIPTVRFRRGEKGNVGGSFFLDCAICLKEFEEEERLRILPSCAHTFHIDCIDTWLQTNDNCPVCRSDIARAERVTIPPLFMNHFLHGQDSVIDVTADVVAHGGNSPRTELPVPPCLAGEEDEPPPRKAGQRFLLQRKVGKLQHACSMGDECIDARDVRDEDFHTLQPMRRSVSMDSSNDRKLYMAVQEILRGQSAHLKGAEGSSSSSGGGGRLRRSFFSFGHGRSCRNAVLPIIRVDPLH